MREHDTAWPQEHGSSYVKLEIALVLSLMAMYVLSMAFVARPSH